MSAELELQSIVNIGAGSPTQVLCKSFIFNYLCVLKLCLGPYYLSKRQRLYSACVIFALTISKIQEVKIIACANVHLLIEACPSLEKLASLKANIGGPWDQS